MPSAFWPQALIKILREQGALELSGECNPSDLAHELGKAVRAESNMSALAKWISDWLIKHEAVLELYVRDDDLMRLLEHLSVDPAMLNAVPKDLEL